MIKVAVIIPYYQKQLGILKKAIDSVISQKNIANISIHIIIIDDGSPISAIEEIKSLPRVNGIKVSCFDKVNGGPASARNFGLDKVEDTTDFIAFLDSDDTWEPEHIYNAVMALNESYDFYFADFFQLDQNISAFKRAKKINPEEHSQICNTPFLHKYNGNMINQIITGNIIGTPTVVIRKTVIDKIRFREEFTSAGEDYLFWIEVCKKTQKIAFSSKPECRCGRGVNVYSGAKWGSTELLIRLYNELKYRKTTMTELVLDNDLQIFLNSKIKLLRKEISRLIIHRILHGKNIPLQLIGKISKMDPRAIFLLPLNYF
ncbi:glycosyltransferase family 2 protein [Sedimenticola selenatireducens]|uniref:Glycosyltransferase n=1 Tax=Sedimenticola selenatireducens TaxID=191960 RepID=A0A557S877_9GAMM|nr:glycosyltransferase [Sedimenticola selenatireducens]TVO73584.1 glycosyltransferase [Sedimenticola selenatireducens]TVT63524.1 MAG: glycosyltransferase [Sedimenticola selenatireducens]